MSLITKFSEQEKTEMKHHYGNWDLDDVIEVGGVTFSKVSGRRESKEWAAEKIEEELSKHYTPYILEQLKKYPFVKKHSERFWLVLKLQEFEIHTSDYVENRVINDKIFSWETLTAELEFRIHFRECEKRASDYIESRVGDYPINNPIDEIQQRIIFKVIEAGGDEKVNFISDFIELRMKDIKCKDVDEEMEVRKILFEYEMHSNPYVENRIKEFNFDNKPYDPRMSTRLDWVTPDVKNSSDLIDKLRAELITRITLEEINRYADDRINEKYDFWISRNFEVKTIDEELEARYTLSNCFNFDSDYINRETNRLISEKLVRNPTEEYKTRINLAYYEDNVKDKEKIANEDEFWDLISVDGLENQALLRDELNKVGEGFCLAKWNQVSILLQTGQTHSCHHPRPHQVPLEELKNNPSALHNTEFKKKQREMMLDGIKPPECDYCWNVEDANPNAFSDRIMKSGEAWAFPYFDKIKDSDPNENIQPTYVEISFSNQCNMACGYCDPKSSSRWQSEINNLGHYPTSGMFNNIEWMKRDGIEPIPHTKPNPYREAFWRWFPDMWPGLHTFRVTGGEPLLSKDTFKVLDYIIENPTVNPRLEMSVNSNLCAPQDKFEEFIDKVKYITDNDLIWNFTLFTSIESWGKHAEYMRDGMDTKRFWNNLDTFLTKCQKPEATIMATYNITSIFSYDKVIEQVFEMKKKHYNGKRYRHYAIILDTSYLRHPEFLSVRILPIKWSEKIRSDVKIMEKYAEEKYTYIYGHGHGGFYDFEREKLRRVADYVESPMEDIGNLLKLRSDFAKYIDEFDKRRGKNFLETFPEMEDFYNSCKKLI